jgi:uncharacterized protein YceK
MRSRIGGSFLLAALITLSGCATLATLSEDETKNKIYSGTIRHIELKCAHATCIDAPFSLVLDTLLLPFTIPKTIWNSSKSEGKNKSDGSSEKNKKISVRQNSKNVKYNSPLHPVSNEFPIFAKVHFTNCIQAYLTNFLLI